MGSVPEIRTRNEKVCPGKTAGGDSIEIVDVAFTGHAISSAHAATIPAHRLVFPRVRGGVDIDIVGFPLFPSQPQRWRERFAHDSAIASYHLQQSIQGGGESIRITQNARTSPRSAPIGRTLRAC